MWSDSRCARPCGEGQPRARLGALEAIDGPHGLANDQRIVGLKIATRSGAYVLLIRLDGRAEIGVGRLGQFTFEAGIYAYVGSAMNGLDARVARHKRHEKKLRWHIDYLLQHAKVVDVIEFESAERRECRINDRIRRGWRSAYPVAGFGASDCRCVSHLHLLPADADVEALRP